MQEDLIKRNITRYKSTKSLLNFVDSKILLPFQISQSELPYLKEEYFSKLSAEMRDSFLDIESIFSDLRYDKGKVMLSYYVSDKMEGLGIIGL